MPAVCHRFSARDIELLPPTRRVDVGVLLTLGRLRCVCWIGSIDVDVAKAIKGAVPVRLEVSRYINQSGAWATVWVDLESGQFVQGCLTTERECGVIWAQIRVTR